MTNELNLAFYLMMACVTVLVVADVLIIYFKGVSQSVSCTMYAWAKAYPIIPFMIGLVMGHFFWNMNP